MKSEVQRRCRTIFSRERGTYYSIGDCQLPIADLAVDAYLYGRPALESRNLQPARKDAAATEAAPIVIENGIVLFQLRENNPAF